MTDTKAKIETKRVTIGDKQVTLKADWATRYLPGSPKYKAAEAAFAAAKPKGKAKAVATPQVDPASVPGMPPMAVVIPADAVAAAF